MSKKIIITGATGLIGRKLTAQLISRGDEVIIFTRDVNKAKSIFPKAFKFVEWNYQNPQQWQNEINGTDAILHLAGVNLFSKRWNDNFKKVILESRRLSTKNIIEAIKASDIKPSVLVSASGVGFYGDGGEKILTEDAPKGNDFLADVCEVWESEASKAEQSGVRSVRIRTGIVLSPEDGALKQMLLPFKLFIGGPLGSGKQWFPWLHIDDIVGIYLFAIDNKNVSGIFNAASPGIVRMKEFASTLGKVLHRPSIFPVPKFALKIAVGEASSAVTASQRVEAKKIIEFGYKFRFEKLEEALKDLL